VFGQQINGSGDMTALILGVFIWVLTHFIPAVEQPLKKSLVDRFGENGYKGVFSLLIVSSIVLIVLGWRSTPEDLLYIAPAWARSLSFPLMVLSFLLIGAAQYPTMIKRFIRHPMLMGVAVWSISHLLINGTTRALILFGGLGLWALIEMLLINRREGPYEKPEAPAFSREIRGVLISAVIFAVVFYLHPYFTGVSPVPR